MGMDEPGARAVPVDAFRHELGAWLDAHADVVAATRPAAPVYADRVAQMVALMGALDAAGWTRWGWPEAVGGRGGSIAHRAALWHELARRGVPGMALFEHLEILAPVLVDRGPVAFVRDALPAYLAGRELWCQGFSEPASGSDLASLRTRAVRDGDGFRVTGRKIWTSWARYATWCLALVRTGSVESRHRGLTALIVDLREPGVDVSPIDQANGTDELAEVAFDEVFVPGDRVVGALDGGWAVAMQILGHERGTFAWFRHRFLAEQLRAESVGDAEGGAHDVALGQAIVDLAAAAALSTDALASVARGDALGPRAAFSKLALCAAEQSIGEWSRDRDALAVAFGGAQPLRREEYLFSRIVTVYGGSQQMQHETIAKQLLRLP